MNPSLNLLYLHSRALGYGRYGMELAKELTKAGITVYDHLRPDGPVPSHAAYIRDKVAGDNAGRSNVICWVTVPPHARGWWKGQVPVISTMFESTRLPESFRETLHNFDTVIVPSPQNVELFSAYHHNVHYVPLGIDPEVWHPIERTPPTNEFRFLIGGSGQRKGVDLAVKAFKKLWPRGMHFGDNPPPTLILKSPRGSEFYGERIQVVAGKISDEEEVALYASAHCYLQPSRGEGFGLQPLQAIAQGCPTILTDAHGHGSFAHLGIGISASASPSGYFLYGEAGEWWEPDFDDLCEEMKFVYEEWEVARTRASVDALIAVEDFTWAHTAQGLVDAIGLERLTPYDGPEGWYSPPSQLFPIVTLRDYTHEVAGAMYHYQKGVEYYEIADVKRILFEAGDVLDPCCLDGGGLAPEQVEREGLYRAMHEHCPTCGHKLNEVVAVDPNQVMIEKLRRTNLGGRA